MKKGKFKILYLFLIMVLSISFIISIVFPSFFKAAQTTSTNINFEGKDKITFFAYGKAKITTDQNTAQEGKKSIKVTDRKSVWDSMGIDVKDVLQRGKTWVISAYVKHQGKKPIEFSITAIYNDGRGLKYLQLGEKIVIPNKWDKIVAKWKPTLKNPIDLIIAIHPTVDKTTAYNVDNIQIMTEEVYQSQAVVFKDTFESNLTNWQPRGDTVQLKIDNTKSHNGNKSLYVSDRSAFWHGVQIPVTKYLVAGKIYKFSVWLYHQSIDKQGFGLTIQRKMANDDQYKYDWITGSQIEGDGWVEISGNYYVPKDGKIEELVFCISSWNPTLAFWVDDVTISDPFKLQEPNYNLPSLKEKYKEDFKVGVAIGYGELISDIDTQFIKKHFNSITPGNEMKPESVLKGPNNYDFTIADAFVDFATKNKMGIRGHTLVWHNQTPDWFFKDENGNFLKKDELLKRLKNHIYTVVSRYKGKIYAWDVVNEAIDETQPDGYRRSNWYNICGPEYIEKAFIWAHEADPQAKLFYNDYNTEIPQKRMFIYNMIKNLKAKGVPIHGIGLQCHINIDNPSVEDIEETIKLFSTIPGLEIQITELDMSFYQWGSSVYYAEPSREMLLKQAKKYYELFNLFKKYKNVIKSVTFWGLKDDNSWLRGVFNKPDFPLLFDEHYDGKPAFWALIDYSILPQNANLPTPPAIPKVKAKK
ncbi:Cellulose 1,4-beta-cellobiosidase [Caldicellulosiruptor kronotskyensis 2002]|uniref:Beta-xylanase n=1 Tax=Caldicellulosiruptor kronotskyensis (strain DSM 18902 / VKM B-2412 / 2002) TaxID=632348 RepID=E4SHI3_CALK2|nr:endo-1,4-beta-xylanase [Caldicellulosiruptor kronotskyensis]ADQ47208.1 Cellulose 1,4-beta-cellobiosidase [Caldicellulosiruptor kronotskyensis 2002]